MKGHYIAAFLKKRKLTSRPWKTAGGFAIRLPPNAAVCAAMIQNQHLFLLRFSQRTDSR
jgi:hypothetical protein